MNIIAKLFGNGKKRKLDVLLAEDMRHNMIVDLYGELNMLDILVNEHKPGISKRVMQNRMDRIFNHLSELGIFGMRVSQPHDSGSEKLSKVIATLQEYADKG